MRQSFATTFFSRRVPAAAFGLMLMPLVTSATAAPEVGAGSGGRAKLTPPATIELHEDGAGHADPCAANEICSARPDVADERAYLVETSRPSGTMLRQGPDVAIGRLHPEFVTRLAGAIREARESGLPHAGIFSAYRPPAFGVGGFKDKFRSLHSYGLAVDMHGIGAAGSSQARLWTRIAAEHGVACPYGVNNPVEWNHCQPTRIKMVRSDSPLVKTIAPQGPINPLSMFEAGQELIESVAKLVASFAGDPAYAEKSDTAVRRASYRGQRVRVADARSPRQHRHDRHVVRKGQKTRSVRLAAAGANHITRNVGHRQGGRRARG